MSVTLKLRGVRMALVSVSILAGAGPAAAASPHAGVKVGALSGSGDWTVTQNYSPALGLGIDFDQKFSFQLRRGSPATIPLDGRTTKLRLRVTVQSLASGSYDDATVNPPVVRHYTCTASSSSTSTATVRTARHAGALRVTVVPLRSLEPGDPKCSDPKADIFWPTDSPWFVRAITARVTLTRPNWFKPASAPWTSAVGDCTDPSSSGTCSTQVSGSTQFTLRARRR